MTAVASLGFYDYITVMGIRQDGEILEYQKYCGNSTLAEMHDLAWIRTMNLDRDISLVAGTKDGRILTYGRSERMDDWAKLNDGNLVDASKITNIVGMDAVLLENGDVYYCRNRTMDDEGRCIGEGAVQALEVWYWNYNGLIYGYAFLTEDGHVRTKVLGDMDAAAEKGKESGVDVVHDALSLQEAETWEDVVQIAATDRTLYGLHRDGSISRVGYGVYNQEDIQTQGIVKIACEGNEIIGIRPDGTAEIIQADEHDVVFGRTQVNSWKDLQDIAIGESHVVGLKKDGTVVAAGSNHAGQCDVESWTDIVFIEADKNCTLGITSDGELKMAGSLN